LVDTRARSSSDSEVVCGLVVGVEFGASAGAMEESTSEKGRRRRRRVQKGWALVCWEEFRCCQGCCAKHTSRRREQDQLTGDEEGRRRV
jgi:hypothetical protein